MLYSHIGGKCIILTIACIITAAAEREKHLPANSLPLFYPLHYLATEAPHYCGLNKHNCHPLSHLPQDLNSAWTGTHTKVTRLLEDIHNFFLPLAIFTFIRFFTFSLAQQLQNLVLKKSIIITCLYYTIKVCTLYPLFLSNSAGQFGLWELIWNKCALSHRWCSSQSLQANGEQTPTPGACLMIAMRLMCFHC